jgi:hypothetical protein
MYKYRPMGEDHKARLDALTDIMMRRVQDEIGNVCNAQGIDSHQAMDVFCMDEKLNLFSYYLKSCFAFGGSCLPKDLRALLYHAHRLDLSVPVLEAILYPVMSSKLSGALSQADRQQEGGRARFQFQGRNRRFARESPGGTD